jgi:hypothetical protein
MDFDVDIIQVCDKLKIGVGRKARTLKHMQL